MAKKKSDIPSAFESAMNDLGFGGADIEGGVTNMDVQDQFVDVEDIDDNNKPDDTKSEENKPEDKADENVDKHDDDSEIPEEVLNQMADLMKDANKGQEDETEETPDEDVTEADVVEAQQVGALFDAVAESFGWNTADIKDDDKPVTVEGLTDYLRKVVEENSVPEYADERIQQLDEYVKNGGNFEDFYAAQQQQINYDKLDLEDEGTQKAVVRDFLKMSGYTDQQIDSKINRYEDAGMLEDEATEAAQRLKAIRAQQVKQLHDQQEEYKKKQLADQKKFYDDMTNAISNLSDIRGLAIPKEDRKALFDYIFKVDQDGLSQYQKDFQANLSKNLIESAYFTMKADKLIQEAKNQGQTTAAQKLKQMLRHTSKNHSSYNAQEEKQRPAWEIASKFL